MSRLVATLFGAPDYSSSPLFGDSYIHPFEMHLHVYFSLMRLVATLFGAPDYSSSPLFGDSYIHPFEMHLHVYFSLIFIHLNLTIIANKIRE